MQRFSSSVLQRSVPFQNHFTSASSPSLWRPLLKRGPAPVYAAALFFLILVTAAFIASIWASTLFSTNAQPTILLSQQHNEGKPKPPTQTLEFPLNCTTGNQTQTCSTPYPTTFENDGLDPSSNPVCPQYFRWIHEDLRPWKSSGITRDMVEKAKKTAHFRLVVINGRAYVETYKKSIQTRDAFTIWGILQLLRRYPGRLPDLELMFDCDDRPVIRARHYLRLNMTAPPPLFRYCGDRWTEDVVFPDWSFWGW